MADLKPSHVLAVIYADIFDYPLNGEEINKYQIAYESSHNQQPYLESMVVTSHGYYHLSGRSKLVTLRRQREKNSQKKLHKARSIADKLARLPFIAGIFVTGNLAMNNADKNDDIDLLIITKANRLWTSRLLVTLYLEITGNRRRPNQTQTRDRICANMYLDETALTMTQAKQNLYTAHEVVQVKPIINKSQVHQRFLSANTWVTHYLPNSLRHAGKGMSETNSIIPDSQTTTSRVWFWLEKLLYNLQYWYMKKRITRETITPHSAFFHPRDTGTMLLKAYNQNLKSFFNRMS